MANESFAEMFESQWAKEPALIGKLAKGKVIAITNTAALVDFGLKAEGAIQLEEFDGNEPKVGDEIEVFVESFEGRGGLGVSLERAKRMSMWNNLKGVFERGEKVTGKITARVKGGFSVSLGGTVAFLPGSHLDTRLVKNPTELMEVDLEFVIIKMDEKRDSIVVSRRLTLEDLNSGSRRQILENIKEGDELEGIVRTVTDYGAFIDLGGIDGLLHITDMSWSRVSSPRDVVSVGQRIKVKVKSYDPEKVHVGLSLKEYGEDPWLNIQQKYPMASRHKGKVCHLTDYGAFVEFEDGIKGLIHVSELSWTRRAMVPNKIVSVRQEVEVEVIDINTEKRRIGLSLKRCSASPWKKFAEAHKVGDKIKGRVRKARSANFFLLDLGNNMDGMVHASDISWDKPQAEAIGQYQEGEEIEVLILDIDAQNERISLGIKQLKRDPFKEMSKAVKKGDLFTCTVKSVDSGGLLVETQDSLVGIVPPSEISQDQDITVKNFRAGERVDAQVIRVDHRARRLVLSVKAREKKEEKEQVKKYGSTGSGAVLGDILGEALKGRGGQADREEKKTDAKAEGKADTKADTKAEGKAESKADTKTDTKADTKTDTKVNTKAESKSDTKTEGKADTKADTRADTKADTRADTKTDTKANTKAESKADTKADAKADAKSSAESKTASKNQGSQKAEPAKSTSSTNPTPSTKE